MSRDEFERRLLELWVTTRVPLTRANLQVLTGVPRKKVERWTDELAREGVVDIDVDDEGEIAWTVKGASRPTRGPTTVQEVASRTTKADGKGDALAVVARTALATPRRTGLAAPASEEKSLTTAGVVGLALGPLGWLYAAPWKHAVPAALVYLVLFSVLPWTLWLGLAGLVHPLSALAGVGYAWRHNRHGERTPLLGPDTESKK